MVLKYLQPLWQKLLLFLVLALSMGGALLLPPTISADENFGIGLVSTYTVTNSGASIVEQKFTLTNKKPTLFAKQYAVEFGSNKLSNIKVFDSSGALPANIVTTDNKTSIGITFDDKVVGEGKARTFTIQFESPDSAVISGNVLEVYVPRFVNAREYDNYEVVIRTPLRYGQPVRVNPHTYTTQTTSQYHELTFRSIGEQGISALFGEKQIFDYTLKYNLENPTNNIGIIQIALPPDTSRQKVMYKSLDPLPEEITRDADGNWIATYRIEAENNLDVILNGKVFITLEPSNQVPETLPTSQLTNSQKYWESDHGQVRDLAKNYSTPKDIYDYVTSAISYNYSKTPSSATRLGAAGVLAEPDNAACQEFTDLFIAMARAANIPARRATGYAYTTNDRLRPLGLENVILHAWPEYYDAARKDWVPIDPTWGHTTGGINYFDQFDFNHFVFAINGTSSTLPYAAGAYKRTQSDTGNVHVVFGEDEPLPELQIETEVRRKPGVLSLFLPEYILEVKNNSGMAWYNLPLQLETTTPELTLHNVPQTLPVLLPFQTQEIGFSARSQQWFRIQPFDLTVTIQGISSKHALTTGFQIQDLTQSSGLAIGMGLGLVFIAFFTWRLLVPRRTR